MPRSLTGRTTSMPPMQELPRRPSMFKVAPGETLKIRLLPPTDFSAIERRVLNQHYMPLGGKHVGFACKGSNCPACKIATPVQRVNVPVQSAGGRGFLSLGQKSARSLRKQLNFGTNYGMTGRDLRDRLFSHAPRADKRKRSKRIAKKILKRRGWLTYDGPAKLVAEGMFDTMSDFGADAGKALNRIVLERFNNRPDVVAMREAMLAEGVPRPERQKAYRALRRLTPLVQDLGDLSAAEVKESIRKARLADLHASPDRPMIIDYMDRLIVHDSVTGRVQGSASDYAEATRDALLSTLEIDWSAKQ